MKLVEYKIQTHICLRSKSTELLCKYEAKEDRRAVCFFSEQESPNHVTDERAIF